MADKTESSSWGRSLLGYLAAGVAWSALTGCVQGLLGDRGLGESVAVGALVGPVAGLIWYAEARRARRFRGSFKPDDRSLRLPDPSVPMPAWSGSRRFRPPFFLRALVMVIALIMSVLAIWATLAPDVPIEAVACLWAVEMAFGAAVWSIQVTSTEVRADGLIVRTPIRRQTITWNDLYKVRWQREATHDVLVFHTFDNRVIKAAGVAVASTGEGERRMLQLRDAVQAAWAAGSVPRQRRRLMRRLASGLRSQLDQRAATERAVAIPSQVER
ncbi:MAG: hypothetical protein HOV76_12830 [Hamadaea sp.]|nr:hypothetical protein [Hamadaea sp.]